MTAIDAHIEQGCHCAPGPCALSAPWIPDSIRHTPHGQPPPDDDDHVATEARRLLALLCAEGR